MAGSEQYGDDALIGDFPFISFVRRAELADYTSVLKVGISLCRSMWIVLRSDAAHIRHCVCKTLSCEYFTHCSPAYLTNLLAVYHLSVDPRWLDNSTMGGNWAGIKFALV